MSEEFIIISSSTENRNQEPTIHLYLVLPAMLISVRTSLSQICQCLIGPWFCELTGVSWVVLLLPGAAVILGLDWAGTSKMAHPPVTRTPGQDYLWWSALGLRRHEGLLSWEPGSGRGQEGGKARSQLQSVRWQGHLDSWAGWNAG